MCEPRPLIVSVLAASSLRHTPTLLPSCGAIGAPHCSAPACQSSSQVSPSWKFWNAPPAPKWKTSSNQQARASTTPSMSVFHHWPSPGAGPSPAPPSVASFQLPTYGELETRTYLYVHQLSGSVSIATVILSPSRVS